MCVQARVRILMCMDISVPQCLNEEAERRTVDAEMQNKRIARACAAPTLPTAGLRWDNQFVSGSPPGAMTPGNARETLTRNAHRRRVARQKAYRSGLGGLLRALNAA